MSQHNFSKIKIQKTVSAILIARKTHLLMFNENCKEGKAEGRRQRAEVNFTNDLGLLYAKN